MPGIESRLRRVAACEEITIIRKLASSQHRIYSRHKDERTGKRRNLGTFDTREVALRHEREIQYFKHH